MVKKDEDRVIGKVLSENDDGTITIQIGDVVDKPKINIYKNIRRLKKKMFGEKVSRIEVNDIARRHANEQAREQAMRHARYVQNSVDNETKRIDQIVAVLLTALPKAVLNKKVKVKDMAYGSLFIGRFDADEKVTINDLLEYIDP